jgi:hypothetical protein
LVLQEQTNKHFLGKLYLRNLEAVKLRNNAISYHATRMALPVTSPQGTKEIAKVHLTSFHYFVSHSAIFGSTQLAVSLAILNFEVMSPLAFQPPSAQVQASHQLYHAPAAYPVQYNTACRGRSLNYTHHG